MHRLARQTPVVAAILTATSQASAQSLPPNDGFDFVRIGAPGNAAWRGDDPFGLASGRGQVNYDYRISRTEVSTAQWMEFVNTFSTQPGSTGPGGPTFVWGPEVAWGAVRDSSYSGPGIRYRLDASISQAADAPVIGISWREAALYCNWLNNGRPTQYSAIQNGAYDASTFVTYPNGTFDDQRTHNPDARFWIPTLDEWMKAAYYDPNRYGAGQPGWWDYSHRSNEAPVSGVPGVGQTSANVNLPNFGEFDIPLGAYSDIQSPWGLLDTSGGAGEWTEEVWASAYRVYKGTTAGNTFADLDNVWTFGADQPYFASLGLRVASAVPPPSTWSVAFLLTWGSAGRRSRRPAI